MTNLWKELEKKAKSVDGVDDLQKKAAARQKELEGQVTELRKEITKRKGETGEIGGLTVHQNFPGH